MSTPQPAPEQSTPAPVASRPAPPPSSSSKSQRVLACVLCQQRKVKCDRRFPCANCTKHNVQCVPATQARRRRRRFPERELLDRLQRYEDLLRQNHVRFEPLHKGTDAIAAARDKDTPEGRYESDEEFHDAGVTDASTPSTPSRAKSAYETKNFWHAMSQGLRDPNGNDASDGDSRGPVFTKTFDHTYSNDNLLLGSRDTAVELATLHPEPVHIFRLWQVYLDNANPLLKVTHTPTLQGRIIEAAGNVRNISPNLEALMFSIYCMATLSLGADECEARFGLPKDDLLVKYQFGCQQALLNSGFLRTNNRDCLTALYLYLISVRFGTDPRSLSSMLGVAIRIAQRMGIHDESATRRFGVLEAEMRRRLWWSLVLFDDRMSNLAEHNSTILSPAWDCKIPLNVNDSDLREEMKEPPKTQKNATEAMCAVVRCELAEFLRHSPSHLDFTNPALKPIAKELPAGGDPDALLKAIEDEYLRFCDLEIPLHFITIWIARAQVSKNHLTRHYSRYPSPYEQPSDSQRDAALFQAFNMLECDTKILNSPLTMGYRWLLQMHFPFPAYIHVVGELRRRPHCQLAEQAWEVMADNFEARFRHTKVLEGSPFIMFTNVVLQAWEALEETLKESDEPMTPPRMITNIKEKLATIAENNTTNSQTEHASGNIMDTGIGDFPMPMPIGFGGPGVGFGPGGPGYSGTDPGVFSNMTAQAPLGVVDPLAFASMYWGFGERRGW